MIIAIDGPAASGKSTVAKAVARRLGIHYLDTGAMYRALAWLALERNVALDDAASLTVLAEGHPVAFEYAEGAALASSVTIAGVDVSTAIRRPEVDAAVSAVASIPGVREVMVAQQRRLAADGDAVVEGRDIGTVVFPDAPIKVFLTASEEERARRRQRDMADVGHDLSAGEVRERLVRRDTADSSRAASPLGVAADADTLDTTGLSVDEVVDAIVARYGSLR